MTHNSGIYDKPIPDLDDPDMAPFWMNTRQHRLTAQQCLNCSALRFPALPICPTCLEIPSDWVDVSSTGTIWSFAVYHRAFHPGFRLDIPYVVGIVETDDGVRFTGRILGPRDEIAVGRRVHVTYLDATDRFTIPQWSLDG